MIEESDGLVHAVHRLILEKHLTPPHRGMSRAAGTPHVYVCHAPHVPHPVCHYIRAPRRRLEDTSPAPSGIREVMPACLWNAVCADEHGVYLIVLGERGDKDDRIHIVKSMDPLAALVALAAHVVPARAPHQDRNWTRRRLFASPRRAPRRRRARNWSRRSFLASPRRAPRRERRFRRGARASRSSCRPRCSAT